LRRRRIVYIRRGHCRHGRRWEQRSCRSGGLFRGEGRRYRHGSRLRSGSGLRVSRSCGGGVRNSRANVGRRSSRRRCGRPRGDRLCGAALPVIHGDHARVEVADFAVFGLDARKNKSVEQDGEALAARNGGDRVRSLARLGENLRALGVSRAVNVTQVVRPSGRGQKTRACEQDEKTCARHRPLLGPGHAEP
jgi:hypothetical protein